MVRRLSLRIALLILIGIPLNFFLFININYVVRLLGVPDSGFPLVIQVGLLIVSTPLILGLLAARYVTRPLRQFVAAIEAVQGTNYHTQLQPSGVREFDQVFAAFNRLTQRLTHEEELRKNLLSDTSHELHTPLTAMLTQLTAMQDGVLPVTNERIGVLTQQTERLIDLVAQLDAYTQARLPNTTACADTPIALRELCEQLGVVFAPLLLENHMRFKIDVSPLVVVRGDKAALEGIIRNLLQNALYHSHGRHIWITGDSSHLCVRDDGQGVAPEHLPYLFERFYRVDASRSRKTGGLGLGLAIVRALAEQHGWQVRAEDGRPGLSIVVQFTVSL
jgi:signal transduction histidine kinase